MNDILTLEDIRRLVDAFYEKVRKDELLGPICLLARKQIMRSGRLAGWPKCFKARLNITGQEDLSIYCN